MSTGHSSPLRTPASIVEDRARPRCVMQQGGHDQTFRLLVFMVSTTVENGNRDKGILKVSVATPRQWSAKVRQERRRSSRRLRLERLDCLARI